MPDEESCLREMLANTTQRLFEQFWSKATRVRDEPTELGLQTLPAEIVRAILYCLDDYSCIVLSRTCSVFAVHTRRLRLELFKACRRAEFEAKFYLLRCPLLRCPQISDAPRPNILPSALLDSNYTFSVGIPGQPLTFGKLFRFDSYYGCTLVHDRPDPEPPLSERGRTTCSKRGWHPVQWIIRKHLPTFYMLPLSQGEIIVLLKHLDAARQTAFARDILLCFPEDSFWGISCVWNRINEAKDEFPIPPAPEQSDRRLWRRVFRILYRNR